MTPRIQPKSRIQLDPDRIVIYLWNFLQTRDECPFCNLLLRLFEHYVDGAEEKIRLAEQKLSCSLDGPIASVVVKSNQPVVITFSEGMHEKASLVRDAIVSEEKIDPRKVYYPPPILVYCPAGKEVLGWPSLGDFKDPEPMLDDNFKFFKSRLQNCVKNHTSTCGRAGGTSLPRRLIDVGTSDSDVIKLVESKKLGSRGRKYATVSHRWADEKLMFRTLRVNFNERLDSIDEDGMPRVLQDSIKVTRALGLRYLWMDTVCLIQDDKDDMGKEIPKMGDYYANAYFTIAASSSKDSTVPFVSRRNSYYTPDWFPFGEDGSGVHVRRLGVEGHLAKRGWVWQESALSVRVLNFAPSELIWECREDVESECEYEPQDLPSLGLARKYHDVQERPFELWQELIQSYSARSLKNFNDLLPAISGLAKRVQDKTGSKYFAGIWEQDLVPSLLWEVTRGFDRIGEPLPKVPDPIDPDTKAHMKCTTPSWSWASIQGWVRTSDTTMGNSSKHAGYRGPGGFTAVNRSFAAMKLDVRNVKVEDIVPSKRDNPFGEVTGGTLKLYGRLIQVTLTCTHKKSTGWTYMVKVPGQPGSGTRISADTELKLYPNPGSWAPYRTVRRSNDTPKSEFAVTAHCLLVVQGPAAPGRRATQDGLVLGLSEDDDDEFKRIGYFSFPNSSCFDGVSYQLVTIV